MHLNYITFSFFESDVYANLA